MNSARAVASRAIGEEWVRNYARAGYTARGIVFTLIGLLAIQVALGARGKTRGPNGALTYLASKPFGAVLLAVLAIGLLAFCAWRLVQALRDTEHKGTTAKGIAARIGYAFSGLLYCGFAVTSLGLIAGHRAQRDGEGAKTLTEKLLSQPFGQLLVGALGVGVIAFGILQLWKAYNIEFAKCLSFDRLSAGQRKALIQVCRVGVAARGVVTGITGVFFLHAAIDANPREAKGLGEALSAVAQQPHGTVLLFLIALGVMAYAAYQFVQARYRRVSS
jgi:hypothetical protein